MNEVFNPGRFFKYLKYDLTSARSNYGLSLLIIGLIPLWAYIIYEIISLISGNGWSDANTGLQYSAAGTAIVMLLLTAPVKLYGSLTEKRSGSSWLLIPASPFEKFLSMLLVTCVAVPVLGLGLMVCSDALLSLIFPGYCEPMVKDFSAILDFHGNAPFTFHPVLLWINWCENILFFTLGAICFKKAKIGKTFLCLMGLGIIITSLIALFAQSPNISTDWLLERFGQDEEAMQRGINLTINAIYFVVFALLDLGIYFRIKTMKH